MLSKTSVLPVWWGGGGGGGLGLGGRGEKRKRKRRKEKKGKKKEKKRAYPFDNSIQILEDTSCKTRREGKGRREG